MGVARFARALTGREVEPEAELVVWLNGVVAIGVGVACWLKVGLSAGATLGLIAGVFVALVASLIHPYAAIVAGVLGSAVAACLGGLVGASIGVRVGGTPGAWAGGVIVAASFLATAASAYRKLVRACLAARDQERSGAL